MTAVHDFRPSSPDMLRARRKNNQVVRIGLPDRAIVSENREARDLPQKGPYKRNSSAGCPGDHASLPPPLPVLLIAASNLMHLRTDDGLEFDRLHRSLLLILLLYHLKL